MLPKHKRLSGEQVDTLFKSARTTGTPFFVARYVKTLDSQAQFAVIAPKTAFKSAVIRNSLRRKWYVAIREIIIQIKPKSGIYAFVLKKEALHTALPERKAALAAYFDRI